MTSVRSVVERLPDDAIVLHIGLHKTGTTAMQSILAGARKELREQGIEYPGRGEAHHNVAFSLLPPTAGFSRSDVPAGQNWQSVAAAAAARPGRTVVSSEFLSRLHAHEIGLLVTALGAERVHVVIGVRHVGAVALSAWQQSLKTGQAHTLEEWIRHNFAADADGRLAGAYWGDQHPVTTVRRWADTVGPDRVYAVVIDDSDPRLLPGLFERLLGLAPGWLSDRTVRMANRSMTAAEAELTMRVNTALREQLDRDQYLRLIRYGMLRRMLEARARGAAEARSELPESGVALAAHEGEVSAREITATGVHVVGDLNSLVETASPTGGGASRELPVDAAVQAVVGTALAAARGSWKGRSAKPDRRRADAARQRTRRSPEGATAVPTIDGARTRVLVAEIVRRVRAAVRQRARRSTS